LFNNFAYLLVVVGKRYYWVPLSAMHKEVDNSPNNVSEENEQQPAYLASASELIICNAVDKHPYPEDGYRDWYKIYS
jgi:hypothetical protein